MVNGVCENSADITCPSGVGSVACEYRLHSLRNSVESLSKPVTGHGGSLREQMLDRRYRLLQWRYSWMHSMETQYFQQL